MEEAGLCGEVALNEDPGDLTPATIFGTVNGPGGWKRKLCPALPGH